jgi:hypothetical protein
MSKPVVTLTEAVDTLRKITGKEPYKTTASWVNTRTFSLTDMYLMGNRPFELDTTLSYSEDSKPLSTPYCAQTGHM